MLMNVELMGHLSPETPNATPFGAIGAVSKAQEPANVARLQRSAVRELGDP